MVKFHCIEFDIPNLFASLVKYLKIGLMLLPFTEVFQRKLAYTEKVLLQVGYFLISEKNESEKYRGNFRRLNFGPGSFLPGK